MSESTEIIQYQNREGICEFCDAPIDNSKKPRGWNRHNYYCPVEYETSSEYSFTQLVIAQV